MKVVPLRGKAPFLEDWIRKATRDEAQIAAWAQEYPHNNCGAVVDEEKFVVDVDDTGWFMENAPPMPKTLVVLTGSGKLHVYFGHTEESRRLPMRAVMNPRWRRKTETDPGTPDEPQKFVEFPDQVVAPGSVHPDTGRKYKVMKDEPIAPCPKEWVEWFRSLESARLGVTRALKVNPLKAGWDPEKELAKAGLKFERSERDGKVYLNYHALHGKCLVRNASHAAAGETPNPRQCAFVYDPATQEFWHQCFSGGCQIPGKTKIALEALGLRIDEVIRPVWRDLFESADDFRNSKELAWIIESLAQEESMNMIGGPSGQGKTWIALEVVKALLTGAKLFQNFAAHKPPKGVLYLIPEVGRRSFYKRVKLLRMDPLLDGDLLLVRTLSMGPVVPLTDRRILKAAEGRDVFLDTAVRFMEGEENDASDNNLAESGFALLAAGARSWWGVHHSPKSFAKSTSMSLEDVLRGTGDIGAMLSTCYGVRQLNADRNLVHVECVKGRDLDELPRPFQIEGRPHIDREGRFRMVKPPGECGFLEEELQELGQGKQGPGRPKNQEKIDAVLADYDEKMPVADIAKKHGMKDDAVYKIIQRARRKKDPDQGGLDGDDKPDY